MLTARVLMQKNCRLGVEWEECCLQSSEQEDSGKADFWLGGGFSCDIKETGIMRIATSMTMLETLVPVNQAGVFMQCEYEME